MSEYLGEAKAIPKILKAKILVLSWDFISAQMRKLSLNNFLDADPIRKESILVSAGSRFVV